jgi:hypothetical protein
MHKIYITGLFILSVIMISCNNKSKDLPAPTRTFFMDTKVDGKQVAYEDSIHGVLNTVSVSSTDYGSYTLIKSSSEFSGTTQFGDSVNTVFSEYKKGCGCTQALIDSMFTTGYHNFKNNTDQEGIEITWYGDGRTYSTSLGSADQSGSFFKIDKHQYVGYTNYRYISSGSLSCKLYSADGDTKIMSGYFNIKTNK